MTRVLVVCNPASARSRDASPDELGDALRPLGDVTTLTPRSSDSLVDDVRIAAEDADLVVVAGGDGSFHHAVNALGERLHDLVFALLPMGTGNDLARTLRLPPTALEAARSLVNARRRTIDVAKVTGGGMERLFVNACMGGFPVEVNEAVDENLKKKLGPLSFWIGGVKAATDVTRFRVEVNGRMVPDCVAIGVGNGTTCGGGVSVWPGADPGDGMLNCCALAPPNLAAAARLATSVKSGAHEGLDGVETLEDRKIEIASEPEIEFNVDGELIGLTSPASFEIVGAMTLAVPLDGGVSG